MGLRDRLPMLMKLRRESLPVLLANAQNREKDQNGCSSSSLSGTLRFLGVAEFVVNGDVEAFREQLRAAASLHNMVLDRYLNGESIDGSYVTMLSYKDILNALAANDLELAHSIAKKIGGRHGLEQEHDHPFDLAFGYCLKAVVERDELGMNEWCPRFLGECASEESVDFRGYAEALDAIRRIDPEDASAALKSVANRHANQCKMGGVFKDTEDETLCVWGIAIANLANSQGLSIALGSPSIPQELVSGKRNGTQPILFGTGID